MSCRGAKRRDQIANALLRHQSPDVHDVVAARQPERVERCAVDRCTIVDLMHAVRDVRRLATVRLAEIVLQIARHHSDVANVADDRTFSAVEQFAARSTPLGALPIQSVDRRNGRCMPRALNGREQARRERLQVNQIVRAKQRRMRETRRDVREVSIERPRIAGVNFCIIPRYDPPLDLACPVRQ